MNGQDLVNEALGRIQKTLFEIEGFRTLEGDPLIAALAEISRDLDAIKGKPTLRTKNGTNMAFPVSEAARRLEEAWAEIRNGGSENELRQAAGELVDAGAVLKQSFKGRTVIMT